MTLQNHFTNENRNKLVKMLRMCGSDHLGERAAAAARAHSLVASCGRDWDDVIAQPITDDMTLLSRAECRAEFLTDWERQFLVGVGRLIHSRQPISTKQRRQLENIAAESEARARAA